MLEKDFSFRGCSDIPLKLEAKTIRELWKLLSVRKKYLGASFSTG